MITNSQNRIFAIPVAAETMFPKPNTAAMIAITKKMILYLSMLFLLANNMYSPNGLLDALPGILRTTLLKFGHNLF